MSFNNIVAIIVTWNPDLVEFRRVIASYEDKIDLIIVDNGSNDLFKRFLYQISCEDINVVDLKDNFGIACAINRGVELASQMNYSRVILFDQDTVVESSTIERLNKSFEYLLRQGVLDPVIGPIPIEKKSNEPIGMYSTLMSQDSSELMEVDSIYTSGMLLSTKLAMRAPQLENFFIDYVDTEWCYRVRAKHDAKIFIDKKSHIKHSVGDSKINILGLRVLIVHAPLRQYYQLRNSIWMLRLDYIPFFDRFFIFSRCLLRVILLSIFAPMSCSRIKWTAKGFIDGIFLTREI